LNAGLQIVGHHEPRTALEKRKHADMRADPVGQALGPAGLGVGVVGGAQHADKDLRWADLAAARVDDRHRLAGIVDEHLLAGEVVLPHYRRQPTFELAVELTEPAVTVAAGVCRAVFLPQHGQIDPGPLYLADQRGPVGLDPPARPRLGTASSEQLLLENRVAELGRQWPGQLRRHGSRQIFLDRTAAHPELTGNRPRAGPRPVMQPQQLTYASHGQPLCRHLLPLSRSGEKTRGRC
jgi:hypothetical protein